jgi:hypothetical protein
MISRWGFQHSVGTQSVGQSTEIAAAIKHTDIPLVEKSHLMDVKIQVIIFEKHNTIPLSTGYYSKSVSENQPIVLFFWCTMFICHAII